MMGAGAVKVESCAGLGLVRWVKEGFVVASQYLSLVRLCSRLKFMKASVA